MGWKIGRLEPGPLEVAIGSFLEQRITSKGGPGGQWGAEFGTVIPPVPCPF